MNERVPIMDQFIVVKSTSSGSLRYLGEIDLFAAIEMEPGLNPADACPETAKWSAYPLDALRWRNLWDAHEVAVRLGGKVFRVDDPIARH
jgi:hypothetical protein